MKTLRFEIDGKKFSAPVKKRFTVQSSRGGYPVRIAAVSKFRQGRDGAALICDENVFRLHGGKFSFAPERTLLVRADENIKTVEGALKLTDFLLRQGLSRRDTVLLAGGGALHDAGGFAAAWLRRGIRWHFAPTTLAAQVDGCIGGKTSLNYGDAKNQLGFVYPPSRVSVDCGFLSTLDVNRLVSGCGELLKNAVIAGEAGLRLYEERVNSALAGNRADCEDLAAVSLAVKKAVVEDDEFGSGSRRALSYGHTTGLALEAMSGWQIPHGLCVLAGMMAENELAVRRGAMSAASRDRVSRLCAEFTGRDRPLFKFSRRRFLELLSLDRKFDGKNVDFALAAEPGKIVFEKVAIGGQIARLAREFIKGNFAQWEKTYECS